MFKLCDWRPAKHVVAYSHL